MINPEDILRALSSVKGDESGASIVALGMISGVTVHKDGKVGFIITLASHQREKQAWFEAACRQTIAALPGVTNVTVVLTAESRVAAREPGNTRDSGHATRKAVWNTEPIPYVHRLIAIASGKGGVGKSTTAVNLAHALKGLSARVGILDADIYGPSIPRMMGLCGTPEAKEGRIIPPIAHGIACMSMGLLVAQESALVWRGPQMSKTLAQLLRGVVWGSKEEPLDALLIDMPPGTGDIHLSLAQQALLQGAVIVTTPQDVAVADARKCMDMFRKVHVPIWGVIENMSGFTNPVTREVYPIFGVGGGKKLAESFGVPFLGEVPIEIGLREASDTGTKFKDSTEIYRSIAAQIMKKW